MEQGDEVSGAFTGELHIRDYYSKAMDEVRSELERMDASRLADADGAALAEALAAKHELEPLDIDPDREFIDEGSESDWRDVQDRFLEINRRREIVYDKLAIPLVPRQSNGAALRIHGSTWLMWTGIERSATFRDYDHRVVLRAQEGKLPQMFDQVKQLIGHINADIASHTPGFRQQVLQAVQARRSQLAGQRQRRDDMMRSLGIPLAKRQGATEPVNVQVRHEIKVLREPPVKPIGPKELYLDPESERAIVGMIHQAGKGFETTPAVYCRLEEEDLRSIILNNLNTVFDTIAATGETFSHRGKTDVFLNVQGRAILIAECKKWKGAQKYADTLEQMFGYLTWRHPSAVMITFSTNKGLSRVVSEADRVTQEHESYYGGFMARHETHRLSNHRHPRDPDKVLKMHHLFFDLYTD